MRPGRLARVGFLLASAGLHALVLGLAAAGGVTPPPPLQVELVAPAPAPERSSAPPAAPRQAAAAAPTAAAAAAAATPADPPRRRRAAPAAADPAPVTPPARYHVEPAEAPPLLFSSGGPASLPAVSGEPASAPAAVSRGPATAPAVGRGPASAPAVAGGPASAPADAVAAAGFLPVADLSGYAPGDARLTLVLRTDRIRRSPYAADVGRVLERFPDHRVLAARTGLDPVAQLDSILISTADPMDVSATFLAARYAFGEPRMRRLFDQRAAADGGTIGWSTVGGRPVGALPSAPGLAPDPRVLVLLRPGVAVFSRPEHVAGLTAAPAAAAGAPQPPVRLSILEAETGAEPDGPALLLTLHDIHAFAAAAAGETMPIPGAARLMVRGLATAPVAHLELTFDAPAQAEAFAARWPARAQRLAAHPLVFFTGLGGLLGRVEARAAGLTVRARVAVRPAELRQILRLIAQIPPSQPSPAASQPASRPVPASGPASQPRR